MTLTATLGGMFAWTVRRLRDPLGARKLVGPVAMDSREIAFYR